MNYDQWNMHFYFCEIYEIRYYVRLQTCLHIRHLCVQNYEFRGATLIIVVTFKMFQLPPTSNIEECRKLRYIEFK
jgi:hypothetical protein